MGRVDEQNLERLIGAVLDANALEGEAVLARLDFARPQAAFGNLARILQPLGPIGPVEAIADLLLETIGESADPDAAVANWACLFHGYFSHSGLASLLLGDPQLAENLSRLFGHSQFLADILLRNPEYIEWLGSPQARTQKTAAVFEREMAEAVSLFSEHASRREALCRYHRRELLRIGLRDLMQLAPLEAVTVELSDLAQATVQTALRLCSERLQARFGMPLSGDGPAPCGFAVIAMGKLGGRELNYSSDIDLVFVHEAPGITSGMVDETGFRTGSISNQEYFAKLGADLIEFLSSHGAEGHFYRVDMRLRPEGTSGALTHSFAACQNYYLGRARLWERIAVLKARGIAGDPSLIEQFERLAAGFVFAETMPSALLGEVGSLKDRIDRAVMASDLADREIKRGRGGIREIEFIVAALQILHGHDQPRLRERSTLAALEALAAERLLSDEDAGLLESAYRFFRRIEHALQCMAWRQTQVLPADEDELAALARKCGVHGATRAESAARFESERRRLAEGVHRLFDDLFHAELKEKPTAAGSPLRVLDSDCPPDEAARLLGPWRLRDRTVVESLRRLARGSPTLFVSADAQRRFERLLPPLLESCRHVPWPDNAVRHFEAFVQACYDAAGYYVLLDESRPILDLLVRLFGTSSHLAQTLIGNPGWFESLVSPETFQPAAGSLEPSAFLDGCGQDPAERLRAIRDSTVLGQLRIGVRYILGLASASESARHLSALADACVEAATRWATEEIVGRASAQPGAPNSAGQEPPFSVLALGKLGRRELTPFSDLDLVFVSAVEQASSLSVSRIAERLIYYLTDPAAGSASFRVDARLRPEGSGSPLVTSFERFRRHFQRNPEIWEIQTYLGARTVAGDRQLGERALDIVAETIMRVVGEKRAGGGPSAIAEAIRTMRGRLEATVSLPDWALADFKRGPGGLVDLEFMAQYLQILHAGERDNLVRAAPREVFEAATVEDWVERDAVTTLADDYEYLRRLESDARLILESKQTYFPADPARLEALTYAPGREPTSAQSLRDEFERRIRRVREQFERVLGKP